MSDRYRFHYLQPPGLKLSDAKAPRAGGETSARVEISSTQTLPGCHAKSCEPSTGGAKAFHPIDFEQLSF
ncbi:hypothetical protein ABH977_008085 [Bradyrhizobium ottawaense]